MWGKNDFLKKKKIIFCNKSPLDDVKVQHFKSKIALEVPYTPRGHEGLIRNTDIAWVRQLCGVSAFDSIPTVSSYYSLSMCDPVDRDTGSARDGTTDREA